MSFPSNKFLTTSEAAKVSGYTRDYIIRLCRAGSVVAHQEGRNWVVDSSSLASFIEQQKIRKEELHESLSETMRRSYVENRVSKAPSLMESASAKEKTLLTTSEAAQVSGYSRDYIIRLCRARKIVATIENREWRVDARALTAFVREQKARREEFHQTLSDSMRQAPRVVQKPVVRQTVPTSLPSEKIFVSWGREAIAVVVALVVVASGAVVARAGAGFGQAVGQLAVATADGFSTMFAPAVSGVEQYLADATTARESAHQTISHINNTTSSGDFALSIPEPTLALTTFSAPVSRATTTVSRSVAIRTASTTFSLPSPARVADSLQAFISNAPAEISALNLALGNAVVSATHFAIGGDIQLAYGISDTAPASARIVVAGVNALGTSLADFGPRTVAGVWNAEYSLAQNFVSTTNTALAFEWKTLQTSGALAYLAGTSASRTAQTLVASVPPNPTALEDRLLGAVGKSALAVQNLASVATALPPLSAGEKVAVSTYFALRGLFDGSTLAVFFSPTPVIVPPSIVVHGTPSIAVATTTTVGVTSNPVYNNYTTVVNGASNAFVNESIGSLRNELLNSINARLQPIQNQVATNVTTIQQVNMIQSLTDLILHTPKVDGATITNSNFTGGANLSATNASFDTLSAGTTALGTTTLTGDLTISGTTTTANFLATTGRLITGTVDTFTSTLATITGLTVTSGTTTNATSTNLFVTDFVFANASSTNSLYLGGTFAGAGLASCSGSSSKLLWNSTTRQFQCGVDAGASGGSAALGAQYSAYQTGTTQTFATSSDTNIGLIVTSGSDTHTFTPTWIGTLADGRIASAATWNAKQAALSFTYPLVNSANTISLAFGTTTANSWSNLQSFANASSSQLSVFQNAYFGGTATSTFTSTGALGIASSSPWAQLSVNPNALGSGVPEFAIGSSTATHFIVTGAGNVGIGTTTPGATLSVVGSMFANHVIPNGTYTNNLSAYDLGANGARWNAVWAGTYNVGTSTFSLKSDSNSNLGFYTAASGGGTQVLTLTSAGRLGVGTTTPSLGLEVLGTSNSTNLTILDPSTTFGVGNISTTNNTFSALAFRTRDTLNRTTTTAQIAGITTTHSSGSVSGDLVFMTDSSGSLTEKMRITSTGYVGIGTQTPYTTLSIIGKNNVDLLYGLGGNGFDTSGSSGGFGGLFAGNGGGITLTMGNGGDANASDDFGYGGNGGSFTWNGGNGGDGAGAYGGYAGPGGSFYATGGQGGDGQYYAESGGYIVLAGGVGGTGTVSGTGGVGGSLQLTGGAGGPGSSVGGNGGSLQLTGGAGDSATSLAGLGGPVVIRGGAGGHNVVSAAGGDVFIIGGAGGSGTNPGGAGSLYLTGGAGGIGGGGVINGGDIVLNSGAAGTGGVAGNILFQTVASGKVGVGTSTPWGLLSASSTSAYPALAIQQNSTGAAATFLGGNVGVGTTTPFATFAINPTAGFASNQFVVGSSTATNFVITNSGKVGIGTTTPAQLLSVGGSGYITGGLGVGVVNTTTGTARVSSQYIAPAGSTGTLSFVINGEANGFYRGASQGGVAFITTIAGVDTFAVTQSLGTVTVGASAFSSAIGSTADAYIKRTAANTLNISSDGSTGTGTLGIGSSTPWAQLSVNPNALGSGVPEFAIGSTTATHFIVTGAGNVGIGTTSPFASLSLTGKGVSTGINFITTNSTNNVTGLAVLDNGKVGVGTTSPGKNALFGVQGTSYFGGDLNISGNALVRGLNDGAVGIYATSTYGTAYTLYSNVGDSFFSGIMGGDLIPGSAACASDTYAIVSTTLFGGNGFCAFTIGGTTGNVGIASSSPYANFSVMAGADFASHALGTAFAIGSSTAGTATSTLFTILTSGNVGVGTTTPFATFAINPTAGFASNQFVVGSSTATNFVITNSGKVGVGTTSPFAALSVNSTAGMPQFAIGSSTGTQFLVDQIGNVGIGVTSFGTGAKLVIADGVNSANKLSISPGYFHSGASAGTVTLDIPNTGLLSVWDNMEVSGSLALAGTSTPWGVVSINASTTPGNPNQPLFVIGSSTATNLIVTGAGNVGVGTSTPAGKLDVFSTGNNALSITGNDNISVLNTTKSGDVTMTQYERSGVAKWNWNLMSSTQDFTLVGTAGTALSIQQSSNNVGIGATPSYKLDVAGFINTDQYSGYKQAGNTILYASSTNSSIAAGGGNAGRNLLTVAGATANTVYGNSALSSASLVSSAVSNTAIGYAAMQYATSTANAVAVGYGALQGGATNGPTGSSLTAIGYQALANNGGGSYNTAIGSQAMYSNVGDAVVGGGGNTAIGYQALYSNTQGWGHVAIGQSAMRNAQVPNVYPGNNGDVAIGYQTLYSDTGGSNVAIGMLSLTNNSTGSGNVGIGIGSLQQITVGGSNIGIGTSALGSATSTTNSVAIGASALGNSTYGIENIAIGASALGNNHGGSYNVGIGRYAINGNSNATSTTAIGWNAGSGTFNSRGAFTNQGGTYIGYAAGGGAYTNGDYNTLIGYQAGDNIGSGSDNVMIGYSDGGTIANGHNNVGIGYNVHFNSDTSNQLNISNIIFGTNTTATSSAGGIPGTLTGNIGIGTTSPMSTLAVAGDTSVGANGASSYKLKFSNTTGTQYIYNRTYGGNNGLVISAGGADTFYFNQDGSLSISGTYSGAGASYTVGNNTILLGNSAYSGDTFSINRTSSAASTRMSLATNAVGDWYYGQSVNSSNFTIVSSTTPSALFTLTPAGNVGIGTTTPATRLVIAGNSSTEDQLTIGTQLVNANTNRNGIQIGNTADISEVVLGQDSTHFINYAWVYNATPANSYGVISTAGTLPLELQSGGGNVGVGTSSPFSNLSVSSIAQQSGTLPLFTVASTTNATLLTVLGNGNVGIGTTTPQGPLSVVISGTNRAIFSNGPMPRNSGIAFNIVGDSSLAALANFDCASTDSCNIRFYSSSSGGYYIQGAGGSSPGGGIATGGYFLYDAANSATRLSVTPQGNIGFNIASSTFGFMNNTSTGVLSTDGNGWDAYSKTQSTSGVAQSSTADVFRFQNAAGTVIANSSVSGYFYVQTVRSDGGSNSSEWILRVETNGNGADGTSALTTVSHVARGSDPATSFAIAGDGGGGAVKLQITTPNLSGNTVNVHVTFIGQIDPPADGVASDSSNTNVPFAVSYAIAQDIHSLYSGTTTSPINIDAIGNVGVGASVPTGGFTNKLVVNGDVAADTFIAPSAAFAANAAAFGLATSSTPAAVLTVGGSGVDLYKLAIYNYASTTELAARLTTDEARMDSLDVRLSKLESGAIGTGTSTPFSTTTLIAGLGNLGVTISNGIFQVGQLIAAQFTVGSAAKPTGITLYDTATGAPYCVSIVNGVSQTAPGVCTVTTLTPPAPPADSGSGTGSSTPPASDTTAPVVSLIGDPAIQLSVGDTFTDPGATALDETDGDLTTHILVSGTVDTSTAGIYTITYSATDTAGNTGSVSRVVTVQ